jgi:hypothetical protein
VDFTFRVRRIHQVEQYFMVRPLQRFTSGRRRRGTPPREHCGRALVVGRGAREDLRASISRRPAGTSSRTDGGLASPAGAMQPTCCEHVNSRG